MPSSLPPGNTFSPRGQGHALLTSLQHAQPADRARLIRQRLTDSVVLGAARLMVWSASAAANANLMEAQRLVHTAACLNASRKDSHLNELLSPATAHSEPVLRLLDDLKWNAMPRLGFDVWPAFGTRCGRPRDAMHVPIPDRMARAAGLPAKIRTMLDLMSYLAADRKFLEASSEAGLLTLALAVAANFRLRTSALRWPRDAADDAQRIQLDDCSRFIAEMLPLKPLPAALEQQVQDWSRQAPQAQRSEARRQKKS